jgi:hypothetical protein
MHRLAIALGSTVADIKQMPVEDLRAWQSFDRQAGLPDVAAQWQRGLLISAKASAGSKVDDFMPLMAWNKPTGVDALLGRLQRGEV